MTEIECYNADCDGTCETWNARSLMEQVQEAFNAITDVFRRVWQALKRLAEKLVDGLIFVLTQHPKWYHIYKHTKKIRVKKKYRCLLLREVNEFIVMNC